MSTEDGAVPDDGVIPRREDTAEPARFVRVSHRPPPRYTVSSDLDLWLIRFELYVRQASIPENQWVAELLPLLDNEAFCVVLQLGLPESAALATITKCLKQQFHRRGISWSGNDDYRRADNSQENSWCSMLEHSGC